jgi:hypothetical protein
MAIGAGVIAVPVDPPAGEPVGAAESVRLDLGNNIVASIDPTTSQVRMTTPTPLVWDPNLAEVDRFDYGRGWTFGEHFIVAEGGTRFYFPALGEAFPLDVAQPTGLIGYPGEDVLAAPAEDGAMLPARGDLPARPYHYTLHHLDTNVTEYFTQHDGDLIGSINLATGARTDWVYDVPHRLARILDEHGGSTTFERTPSRVAITAPDGRITSVWTAETIERIITATHRTYINRSQRSADIFIEVETEESSGTSTSGIYLFDWDWERPGHVVQVRRIADGVEKVVYPIPPGPSGERPLVR